MTPIVRMRLVEARQQQRLSQQEAADALGTTQNNVSRWERGITTPNPYFRTKLCDLFGKSAEELGLLDEKLPGDKKRSLTSELVTLEQDISECKSNIINDSTMHDAENNCEIGKPEEMEETATEMSEPSVLASRSLRFYQRRALVLGVCGAVLATGIGGGLWWSTKARSYYKIPMQTKEPAITTLYSYPSSPAYTMNDVDWSHSGKFLVCAVGDKTIQILKAQTGDVTMVYRGHADYTECAKWAPDESRVASASKDHTVQIWDPMTGMLLLTYRGHMASVMYLAWSHSGLYIASGGVDSTVHVWDAFTGELITTYRGHKGTVWSVRWSPDDKSIVSGGEDGIVHVWNSANAQSSLTFIYDGPRTTAIDEVDWSPAPGRQIVSAHANGDVYLWDALVGSLMLTYTKHTAAARTARWSPDGRWIASGGADKTVQIWNALTGQQLLSYTKHTSDIFEVSWSPDGTCIASASNDYTMQVCRIQL